MTSTTTRILVTGGDGILATALRPYFPHATYASHRSLDVADGGSVRRFFAQHQPFDVVIHAGAVTSNRAEGAAYCQTNIVGTAAVLAQARKQGARFVLLSSDYVYADTGSPHPETDPLQPVNTYAWSKLGAECVAQTYAQSVIVRGSWYSSLLLTAASTDGFTSKQPVDRAAAQIAAVVTSSLTGVVNVGGPRRSLYEIVATEFNPKCRAITRAEAALPYPIPRDSSVSCDRLARLA